MPLALAALGPLFTPAVPSALAAPAPAWQPLAVTAPTNLPPLRSETKRLGVDAEGGTFTLSFGAGGVGVGTTAPISATASAAEVEAALNAITNISGVGSVSVLGGPGDKNSNHPYFVTFDGGALADTNVGEMTANSAGLSGGATNTATLTTSAQGGPGIATIVIFLQNAGGAASDGPIAVEDALPPALSLADLPSGSGWECTEPGSNSVACTTTRSIAPGAVSPPISIPVKTEASAPGGETNSVRISGGGAAPVTYEEPVTISPQPATAGIQAFAAGFREPDGSLASQAAVHPDSASFALLFNTVAAPAGKPVPPADAKTISIALPPGFLANPAALPGCAAGSEDQECSLDAQVGIVAALNDLGESPHLVALHSRDGPPGYLGALTFTPPTYAKITAIARMRSDGDYGTVVELPNLLQEKRIYGAFLTLWGAPADPRHDELRCQEVVFEFGCGPSTVERSAFLTQSASCALQAARPPSVALSLDTWQHPRAFDRRDLSLPPVSGCELLAPSATVEVQPASTSADSPTSLTARIATSTAGLLDPAALGPAPLRAATLQLPDGVVVNPPLADGLAVCTESEIGLENRIDPATGLPESEPAPNPLRFSKDPNTCPEASRIGTVEAITPLLGAPLNGALYLAAQGTGNPFGSLLALYLVIEDAATGLTIKLPAKVTLDPRTGQVAVAIDDLPQFPIESLKLSFKGGTRAPFATPTVCGAYSTVSEVEPWSAPQSGPPFHPQAAFNITSGPGGSSCATTPPARPFGIGLNAGSENANARGYSPFQVQITRPDGAQEIEKLNVTTPPGLAAVLRGVPYCSNASIAAAEAAGGASEQQKPSCPPGSRVGTTLIGAGAGSNPFYISGKLYLAGPYRGAPLSLIAVTPALVGPFDLGNVVLRSALYVDPATAQVTAISDPLPRFLKGVALRVRDIRVDLDREHWTINPTSCDPMSVQATAFGTDGAAAHLSNRFQVEGCAVLGFNPRLALRLSGALARNGHPALRATLRSVPGEAGIAGLTLTLPSGELLDTHHLRALCARALAPERCPSDSRLGYARLWSPLLDGPLEGPVYLRTPTRGLPDLLADLRADQLHVVIHGHITAPGGRLRVRLPALPDIPLTKASITIAGGRAGLLVNSEALCARPRRTTAVLSAHNGKQRRLRPLLRLSGRC